MGTLFELSNISTFTLEATSVDNCCIEIESSKPGEQSVEVPIFDGSVKEWVEAIDQAGLKVAIDCSGNCCEKMRPYIREPVHVLRNDSFVTAFPHSKVRITYGIKFPHVEHMRSLGLSTVVQTAIICRLKVLDLIGDFSLLAQGGNQGLVEAHTIAYKGEHSLQAEFVRHLSGIN